MPLCDADGTPMSFVQGGVLTLDLSSIVGWAYGPLNQPRPQYARSIKLPIIGGEGCRYCGLSNDLAELLEATGAVHMVLEAPLPLAALLGHSNQRAVYQQLSLRAIARCEAYRASCEVTEIDAQTARGAVMGQRRFSKDAVKREVFQFCRKRGVMVPDHHAGDACIVWWYQRQLELGIAPCAGPLFREAA